ncbi:MAG: manganese efflux pump [Clostridia bacterium]|nr:manganese efflux pump [Clostridia bacterium]
MFNIIISAVVLAIGLAMDAFAVSMCKGLAVKKLEWKHLIITGLYFGIFQALMPTIGYFLGTSFEKYISSVDHWVAFILLGIIGVNMIRESMSKCEECGDHKDDFSFKAMFPLAIATSIDALVAGIGFIGAGNLNVPLTISLVGLITFTTSAIGVKIGNLFGSRYKSKAELAGGIVLVAMGLKFLIEGLMETV